jgi:hypothetical protein
MSFISILRAVSLAAVILSILLTIAGFGLAPGHSLAGSESLAPESVVQPSLIVSALVNNKKAFAIALGVSSVALVGSYYEEIKGFFKETIVMKTIVKQKDANDKDNNQHITTESENKNGQAGQATPAVINPDVSPANPSMYDKPEVETSGINSSSSSRSSASSHENTFIDDEEDKAPGYIAMAVEYVKSRMYKVAKSVVMSVVDVGMTVGCFVNGGDYGSMKKEINENPIFNDFENVENRNPRNAIHLAASVARGLGLKNSAAIFVQDFESMIEHPPETKPKLRHSVFEVAKSYVAGKPKEEIKELIKEKAINHAAYFIASKYPTYKISIDSEPQKNNIDRLDHGATSVNGRLDKVSIADNIASKYSANNSNNSVARSVSQRNSYRSQGSLAHSVASNPRGQTVRDSVQSDNPMEKSGHSAEYYHDRYGGFI